MTRLLLILLLALPCAAGDRLWRVSLAAVAGASVADVASSVGGQECNVLAAGRGGRFAVGRGAAIKAGVFGANLAVQTKARRHRKLATIINFAVAGLYTAAAIHNTREK
jgi:hypothetical protein